MVPPSKRIYTDLQLGFSPPPSLHLLHIPQEVLDIDTLDWLSSTFELGRSYPDPRPDQYQNDTKCSSNIRCANYVYGPLSPKDYCAN